MVDLTPPSSSANTPKREMDVDERRYSSSSEGELGASDTELDENEPVETGQATPPLVEGEAGGASGGGGTAKKTRRPKDGLYESEIVQRWNREIGDIFAQPSSSQSSSQPQQQDK